MLGGGETSEVGADAGGSPERVGGLPRQRKHECCHDAQHTPCMPEASMPRMQDGRRGGGREGGWRMEGERCEER
eukprot:3066792-Rhodomonas_salina.1